jgi:hypothetical protein
LVVEVSTVIDMRCKEMSNGFDISRPATYLGGMFADRVRRAFRAVTRHVDVMPDTLVIRALDAPERVSAGRG